MGKKESQNGVRGNGTLSTPKFAKKILFQEDKKPLFCIIAVLFFIHYG